MIEKPCPFCGAKAVIEQSSGAWLAYCEDIDDCGNMGFVDQKAVYYEDMLEKWNKRADSTQETI